MKLFVVGQFKGKTEKGADWEFQGVYDSESVAVAACKDEMYFVAPAILNEPIGHEGEEWPGCWYPLLEKRPEQPNE